jgi:hypothetical protein
VTDDGAALILYSAALRWRGPTIHYTSLLAHRSGLPTRTRFSLRKQPPPLATERGIAWHSRAWRADGSWCDTGVAHHELLYDSGAGLLEWNCTAPRAVAEVRTGKEWFRGWGYVEHLRLTVPPWRLPIQRVRWGRFINAIDALVWIDWSGPYEKQVVYDRGAAVAARAIGDREIVLADGKTVLSLDRPAVLREGALGATALAVLPNLDRLFPAALLHVRETKWLSHATLRRPGCADSSGMAIHEIVEWP